MNCFCVFDGVSSLFSVFSLLPSFASVFPVPGTPEVPVRLIPSPLKSWKPWYYRALIPALCRLGPERCDKALERLGRIAARRPGKVTKIEARLDAARRTLGASWDPVKARESLIGNLARFSARDCTLGGLADDDAIARFEVVGGEHLDRAIGSGRGVILLGCHFGAYLAAMHWLIRRRVPLRLMLQRPRHVSAELSRWFDRAGSLDDPDASRPGRDPQTEFFLRRKMPPGDGALRVIRARSALLNGLAVFINGDVAWDAGCSRPGTLLGRRARYQSAWTDLAILTRSPVLPIFCSHRPGGRFALTMDPPWHLVPGDQQASVDRFLSRLESAIADEPNEAIAHLLWPDDEPASVRPDTLCDVNVL